MPATRFFHVPICLCSHPILNCKPFVRNRIDLTLITLLCINISSLFIACVLRSGQNTVELLAIADKRIADLNEEIRILEKQVKRANLGSSYLFKVTEEYSY